ncbi:AMP-binding protein [Amycolatopsis sp. NPDC051106]|uniref:AMP-binding protein n=1 Tax=unclassified Amycolatopsis TaxID=2618356 RepID=UPI0034332962
MSPCNAPGQHARAEAAILAPLREKLGFGDLKWAVSGAAPIPPETLEFFAGLGLRVSEIWGMSELTCIASVAPATPAQLGTVGKILPGMEMRVAADGELRMRGPLVMKGYRGEPGKTAEVLDADGWLSTGDIVTVDAEGYLTVVDRKKELIINASGKNMSPANIENAVKARCSLIAGVVAIGDRRPYTTALVVLDPEALTGRGIATTPADLPRHPDVVADVAAAIATANTGLSRVEQIKRFRVLPHFWEPGGDELTPTMKLRRKPIAAKYAPEIDDLYADPIIDDVREPAVP